ncbi:MAG: type VI secretion system protein TssA [Burkholderiales bacterium]|nr:type VI secretion system protein TssA [Burkholderiales bacterium]
MKQEDLLSPISAEQPGGEDLSFSSEFDQIAEMRREDDPTLDQGEWVTSLKVANWPGVVALCSDLLQHRSKDLRLAMWLTESLALTEGYAGLHTGLAVCAALSERFWDHLHPTIENGDMEERVGNLSWLLQRLVSLSDTLPVVRQKQGASFSLQDWQMAKSQTGAADSNAPAADKAQLETFRKALRDTPLDHLQRHLDGLKSCLAQLLAWQSIIDDKMGAEGPSFVSAKEALSRALHDMERLAKEAGLHLSPIEPTQADPAVSTDSPGTPDLDGRASNHASGPIRSRPQALQQLREVAAFFRRTEPHSPVAYLAEKAVKWGDMPLHEWLRKVIKDQGSMSHLQELLGLDAEPGESST